MRSAATAAVLLALSTPVSAQDDALKSVVNPPTLPDSTQFGYSQATVAAADAPIIHVSGQVGYDAASQDNGFEAQVDRAIANLGFALDAAGVGFQDVVKITMLVVDHDKEKLAYLGKKRKAAFGDAPPASMLIPVTRLYADGVAFEIDAVAVATASQ